MAVVWLLRPNFVHGGYETWHTVHTRVSTSFGYNANHYAKTALFKPRGKEAPKQLCELRVVCMDASTR